jgi:hypothetical protein
MPRRRDSRFQRVPEHQPPRWPDPHYPQQVHIDVMVDDVVAAGVAVLKLGGPSVLPDPATSLGSGDPAQPRLALRTNLASYHQLGGTRPPREIDRYAGDPMNITGIWR